MKVKVKQGFIDKYTKERYIPGETLEITPERYLEIKEVEDKLKRRLVEVFEEQEENRDVSREELKEMKVEELREYCKQHNLNDKGKKEELIERICAGAMEERPQKEIEEGEQVEGHE